MTDLINNDSINQILPGLYIIATPIGNMLDLPIRAKNILKLADVVLCEDTRHTSKLLKHYNIKSQTIAYHEHNASAVRPKILKRLKNGETHALVSDAGTPLLADPGFKLVREAIDQNIMISGVPGPNAGIFALILSGLPSNKYLFLGFLSAKAKSRQTELKEFCNINASLIIYESPRRLPSLLRDAYNVLGSRECAIARELTKYYEEVIRGSLSELAEKFTSSDILKGEFTVVIGPPKKNDQEYINDKTDKELQILLKHMSIKNAVDFLSHSSSIKRNVLYNRAVLLKNKNQ